MTTQVRDTYCPACGGSDAQVVQSIDLVAQHRQLAPRNPDIQQSLTRYTGIDSPQYLMLSCSRCALEYARPFQAPTERWYSLAYSLHPLYPAERWEFTYLLPRLQKNLRTAELGCGSGEFLKKCRDKGLGCFGVDFMVDAIEQCRAAGLDAAVLDLSDESALTSPPREFDTIVSFQVLEHVDNPKAFFELAHAWTGKCGEFWVAVPSDRRITRIYNERDLLDDPPHHMTRWTANALSAIGSSAGWTLEDVIYEPLQFSAALWALSIRLYPYAAARSIMKTRMLERILRYGLYPVAFLQWLKNRRQVSGHTMLAKFVKVKR